MADSLLASASNAAPVPPIAADAVAAPGPAPSGEFDTNSINTSPSDASNSKNAKQPPKSNDGSSSANKKNNRANGNDPPLRQGKWTREEEEYVHCLIDEFKTGMMPLAEGTSLRTFLSKMLGCHPMRISKKFVGSNYNGKQVYARRTGADRLSNEEVRDRRAKLCDLERKFLAKIGVSKSSTGMESVASVAPSTGGGSVLNMQSAAMAAAAAAGGNSTLSLQNLGGNNTGVSVSASGVELRNLINQVAVSQTQKQQQNQQQQFGSSSEFPHNLSNLFEVSLNDQGNNNNGQSSGSQNNANSASSNQSLQNIFQGLLASSGSNNNMNSNSSSHKMNSNNGGNSNGGSMEAFQALMQQQQNNAPRPNSRAAAAGRALLQSGSGLGLGGMVAAAKPHSPRGGHSHSSSNEVSKPLSAYTDAELVEELRKRQSLRKIMDSLGAGTGNTSNNNTNQTPFACMQDSADSSGSNALSSLIRNSSIDMSNLIERQGSIDSLSNLAVRSRLQSIQSMGSLLDPLLGDGGNNNSRNDNSNWTGLNQQGSVADLGQIDLSNLGDLAAKVSQDNFPSSRRTANELMESLGVSRASLNSFTNAASAASNNSSSRPNSNSGLNLASLLNNEDALRRLEAAAPSSLNQNFSFQHQNNNSGSGNNVAHQQQSQQSSDNNTAIAQFLLQKKLMEAQNGGSNNNNNNSDQRQLMMNVAAAASSSRNGNGNSSMDPFMSSLLSSLRSSSDEKQPQLDDMESLKRKFFSQEGLSGQDDEQSRNKPFR